MDKDFSSFVISTNRLKLLLPTLKYKKVLFTGLTKEVTTFMYSSPFRSVKKVRKFVRYFKKAYLNKTDLLCLVIRKSDSKFLGIVALHHLERKDPEFGIWLCSWAR